MFIDDDSRLKHILDSAYQIRRFARNKSRTDFNTDEMLTLAILRCLEVIGEAASGITKQRQAELPQINWSNIVEMQNRIIHD